MDLIDIILLSLALGVDCLVVSFSQGLIFKSRRRINSTKLAFCMGLFQGLMPIIGYIGTDKMYKILLPFSKWIVFGVFLILGSRFVSEAIKNEKKELIQCIEWRCLLGLSVATSIDALISGATIRLTSTDLGLCCLIIGVGSFLMSEIGFWSGNFIKILPARYLQYAGGGILILLGIKSILI